MNDMRQMTALGRSIEDGSFAIVDREAGPHDFPAAEWQGQDVVVAVRTAVKHDRYSSWSNRIALHVVPPLEPPVATAEPTAQGIALRWTPQRAGLTYRIYRQSAAANQPVTVGTSDQPHFVDTSAQDDIDYRYTVVAAEQQAESLPSAVVLAKLVDKFAPSVPAGLTALAGPDSVEVSWQRSPEADTQGYYVYRSVNGGPLERQGALVTLPAPRSLVFRSAAHRAPVASTPFHFHCERGRQQNNAGGEQERCVFHDARTAQAESPEQRTECTGVK